MKNIYKTNRILCSVIILCIAVFTSCSKNDPNPPEKQVDIYTVGVESGKSVVRKNGEILYPLTILTQYVGNNIFVSGNDVYITGTEEGASGNYIAKVIKNGNELYALSNGSFDAVTSSIFVSGNDVYTAGYEIGASGKNIAKVWKNDQVKFSLSNGSFEAVATSVVVSGNDVYAAGYEQNAAGNYTAKVWKNGNLLYTLSDGSETAVVTSVYVSGSDVYVAGSGGGRGKVWKNGIDTHFLNETSTGLFSVYVSGKDVYAAGYKSEGSGSSHVSTAKLWKNGVAANLSNAENMETAYSVVVSGSDIYVSGGIFSNSGVVWKNGEVLYNLPGAATSMFVLEK